MLIEKICMDWPIWNAFLAFFLEIGSNWISRNFKFTQNCGIDVDKTALEMFSTFTATLYAIAVHDYFGTPKWRRWNSSRFSEQTGNLQWNQLMGSLADQSRIIWIGLQFDRCSQMTAHKCAYEPTVSLAWLHVHLRNRQQAAFTALVITLIRLDFRHRAVFRFVIYKIWFSNA